VIRLDDRESSHGGQKRFDNLHVAIGHVKGPFLTVSLLGTSTDDNDITLAGFLVCSGSDSNSATTI